MRKLPYFLYILFSICFFFSNSLSSNPGSLCSSSALRGEKINKKIMNPINRAIKISSKIKVTKSPQLKLISFFIARNNNNNEETKKCFHLGSSTEFNFNYIVTITIYVLLNHARQN